MKNKFGLTRSKEVMKASAPTEKKESSSELHHMRVYPAGEDGSVKITHHLGEQEPAHETFAFEDKEGEKLVNHILEHSGAPYGSEGGGEHYADESKTATA